MPALREKVVWITGAGSLMPGVVNNSPNNYTKLNKVFTAPR
jgi:hypothetical protein